MAEDKALQKRYGQEFPDSKDWKNGKKWKAWLDKQKKEQDRSMKDKRLHYSRHRNFRVGRQWISTRDGRLWREPQADANDIRIVDNRIGPALDYRLGVIAEQRPGFRYGPLGTGNVARETAEAQQAVVEYYYHMLKAWNLFMDAEFNAQTDGAAFIHVYINDKAGPTIEDVEYVPAEDSRYQNLVSQGYEVDESGNVVLPLSESGEPADPGVPPRVLFGGEIENRIVLATEVVFDPEARTVNGPIDRAKWAVIRRMRSLESARLEIGDDKLEGDQLLQSEVDSLDMPMDRGEYQRGLPPFPSGRKGMREGIYEYIIFITPDPLIPELEKGLWVKVLGEKVVDLHEELPGGVIPLARVTDGSPDPDMFPRPVMSDWIGDQIAINMIKSLLTKHARWFSGGRLMAQKGTVFGETFSGIVGSIIEYTGLKPDVMSAVSAGQDAWELLNMYIKALEDKTFYNDLARGKVSEQGSMQDVSGRALLASEQLLERAFGPVVRAVAEGGTEWADLIVVYAKYLFDEPRLIPIVGRGDLAKKISKEDLGEKTLVYVDPETMMPMPRAHRHQMLYEMKQNGDISLQEYRNRAPFAEIKNVHMGELDQWDRAQWMNTVLEDRWEDLAMLPPEELYGPFNTPILWWDEPKIHKVALQEIILNERKPWEVRRLAIDRCGIYEELEQAKMNPTIPVPFEVLGVPPMRLIAPGPAPSNVPSVGGAPMSAPPVSATPEMTGGMAPPPITQEGPVPLGNYGEVEQLAGGEANAG